MDYVIITAGGLGTRMGKEIPKQFLKLSDKIILMHSIERFYDFKNDIKIIISLPENYINYWKNLCKRYRFTIKHKIVKGGETRFHSIQNALNEVSGKGLVAVHDGVRPLVSIETINRTFETAKLYGSGIASTDIFFSIRKITGEKSVAVNREIYKEIQTPQTFKISLLKKAYLQKFDDAFTDDASVVESIGEIIHLTEGNRDNIKITTSEDLKTAELFYQTKVN